MKNVSIYLSIGVDDDVTDIGNFEIDVKNLVLIHPKVHECKVEIASIDTESI